MSAARRKGNALEMNVARRLQRIDGHDPRLAAMETSSGRLGPVYTLQIDAATRRLAIECKNREDNPARLWSWLDGLAIAARRLADRLGDTDAKVPVLVIKRNRREPLAVMRLTDLERGMAALDAYMREESDGT